MKEKCKKLTIVVGILLLVIGVSFKIATSLANKDSLRNNSTIAKISGATLNTEGTLKINDTSSIKVTATGSNELVAYNLIWKGTNKLNTQLYYTVYKTSSKISDKAKIESLGEAISSGTINPNASETKTVLVKDEFITATKDGDTKYYYIVLKSEEEIKNIKENFIGKITTEASNAKPKIDLLAVYIADDSGNYQKASDIPQSGYTLNTSKSTCSNGAIPDWNYNDNYFIAKNLTKSGTSCYLYFDVREGKNTSDIIAGATAGSTTGFTAASTTNEGIKTGTDDDGTTYYFRGAVDNNWVKFAGFYWRIIRINGDKTIRMIYNGTSTATTGDGTQISTSAYNSSYNDNAYVGYMYGTVGSSTYAATHANTNNSTIKTALDNWYETNILDKGYDGKVDKSAGFCNDRSIASSSDTWWTDDTKRGYGTNATAYGPFSRAMTTTSGSWNTTQTPTFKCSQSNDLFTTTSASKGNKKLTYPIGLITLDEVIYAGGFGSKVNSSYYLYTNTNYWTMSSYRMVSNGAAIVFAVESGGNLYNGDSVPHVYGVRPVINLRADTLFAPDGNGTASNPYVVYD